MMGKARSKAIRRKLKAFIVGRPNKTIGVFPRFSPYELIQQFKSQQSKQKTLIFRKEKKLVIINNVEFKI